MSPTDKYASLSSEDMLYLSPQIDQLSIHLIGNPPPMHPDVPYTHTTPFIDIISSQNEDPFCLETFLTLIEAHAKQNKDFIIARVMTNDPQDEKRLYYSYYQAHHLNKVLFRTQPEEGLLHRMKARNPLNNMVILGDVHYYVIPAHEARRLLGMNDEPQRQLMKDFVGGKHAQRWTQDIESLNELSVRSMDHAFSSLQPYLRDSLDGYSPRKRVRSYSYLNGQMKDDTIPLIPKRFNAEYFGNEDDFLMTSSVRTFFRNNALDPSDAILFTLNLELQSSVLPNFGMESEESVRDANLRLWYRLKALFKRKQTRLSVFLYLFTGIILSFRSVPPEFLWVFWFCYLFVLSLIILILL